MLRECAGAGFDRKGCGWCEDLDKPGQPPPVTEAFAMADRWTTAQLSRIAQALQLSGYREAAEFVALAALSVDTVSLLKSGRRRRLRNSYRRAAAAREADRSLAIVVPFPSRRRTAKRTT
jgi:hypothetical protein